jgi:hypothetical protein
MRSFEETEMFKLTATAAVAVLIAGAAQADKPPTRPAPIFVIALENHNFIQPANYTEQQQIYHNTAAPYINSLVTPGNPNAQYVSFASRYLNVIDQNAVSVHPSEPNYVWSEAGVHGPLNDNDPYPSNIVKGPSLSAELQAAGFAWKSYQEDTDLVTTRGQLTNTVKPANKWTVPLVSFSGTSPAYTNVYNGSHQYNYATKHNPMVFFTTTNGGKDVTPKNPQAKYYAPLQQLATDLADNTVAQYNWITPDEYNDMHSPLNAGFTYHGVHYTGDQSAIAAGDNFVSQVVPMIEASQAFQNGGVIIIWDDENEGETEEDGKFSAPEIIISKLAKGNATKVEVTYNHSSDLRTFEKLFGLTPAHGDAWLGDTAKSNTLAAMFQDGALPALADEPR